MPVFTRWSIRFAFACLLSSWFLEFWRVAQSDFLPHLLWANRMTIYHLFFVGWLTQMIFGVAYWMFPTESRERPRGSDKLSLATLVLLNLGILLRTVCEPLYTTHTQNRILAYLLVISGIIQWFAALFFTLNIWRRVRGKKNQKKNKKREQHATP